MIEYPLLKPTASNKFIVVYPYVYKDVTIPAGYRTNGADIPRIFWSIVPPFKPKYLPAVIIHDYLCDMEEYEKADKYFKEMLLKIEDGIITRKMTKAVKLYHKIKYGV